ncbi:regulator of sigma E protease [Trypanosoma cruzi]|nr:regulator of sigma E protease [Trypanosoma cruzi]
MKAHGRRTNPGTPIVGEGLTRGFCDSSTVSPTSASRAGRYRKCQACRRAKIGQRTSASSNDSHSPSATPPPQPPPAAKPPDGPRGTLPHMLWECPRLRPLSVRTLGENPFRITALFETGKPDGPGLLTNGRRDLRKNGQKKAFLDS